MPDPLLSDPAACELAPPRPRVRAVLRVLLVLGVAALGLFALLVGGTVLAAATGYGY